MKTIKVFLSGVVVYLSVASIHACGGSDTLPPWSAGASSSIGTGGATGAGGTVGMGGAPVVSTSSAGGKASGAGGSITNPVDDALADSGSRIKARWIVGDDGSKQFAGFYDSLRKEECFFYDMYDGAKHCVPFAAVTKNYAGYYLDSACTSLISAFYVSACAVPSDYAYSNPGSTCVAGYKIYQNGIKITPPVVYYMKGSVCTSSAPDPSYEYHLVGPEVPPSAFVAGSVITDP
jgi:hypothetical protein